MVPAVAPYGIGNMKPRHHLQGLMAHVPEMILSQQAHP